MPRFAAPPGYRFVRKLGGGSDARVFEATSPLGEPVVVKVLRSADDDVIARFRRELAAGLAIRHPHLVRIDGGKTDGPPFYLVMERVPGDSLKKRVVTNGRMAVPVALGVARQLAEALALLHAAGFVHADVKPANVVVPTPGRAVLVDLGFAHRPGELDSVLGTANYLAPELCVAPFRDGFAVDVYALGVTLFELLTGRLPYPEGSQSGVMRSHRDVEPDRLSDHRGVWPRSLEWFVEDLLTPDPDVRPTAKEVVRRIAELQIETLRRAA
jgi:eukaryotic-like serine/threonine-protein kinase